MGKTDKFDGPAGNVLIEKQLLNETCRIFTLTFTNFKRDEMNLMSHQLDALNKMVSIYSSGKVYKTRWCEGKEENRQADYLGQEILNSSEDLRNFMKSVKDKPDLINEIRMEKLNCFKTTLSPIEYEVRIYLPVKFEAFRKLYCGSYTEFILSIAKCTGW